MALLIPTASENELLARMLGKITPDALTLKLFVNNYTPVDGSVAGSFTEMSTQGYASKTLAMADWTVTQVSSKGSAASTERTWTFDGTGGSTTVYGYFVVTTGGALVWAERFAVSRVVTTNGDQLIFTPTITFSTA